jgi:predicted phage terminase large subunit-like protein
MYQETTDILPVSKPERMQRIYKNPIAAIRELNNRSLFNFLEYFWPAVSAQEFKPNWHIPYLCHELEMVAERVGTRKLKEYDLIINIPPGTTKTITCSIMFPAWCWTKWPWMRFITASYSGALSLESAEYCRDLIRSEAFRQIYPDIEIKEDKDTKSNFKLVQKIYEHPGQRPRLILGGNRYSTSVGGTLTGFHGDILIWDDALNPTEAVSDKDRDSANRWIDQTLPTRKTDKGISAIIGIMQRLHQDDPTGHILAKKKENVKHICLPGEIRHFKEKVNPPELVENYVDELLDPRRLNWANLKDLEADLGQYGYAGQIGQDPTPPGGGMFKIAHFQTAFTMPPKNMIVRTIRYWDKAGSDGTGAYTVGVKMSLLKNGMFLVGDVKRGQWSAEQRESIIREVAIMDGKEVRIYMEQEPGSGGKDSVQASIRGLAGWAVYADKPTGDKIFRADPYSVQVNNGYVQLLQGAWNEAYLEELRFFPFGTYKDQVDASSGAFNKLTEKRIARRIT